MRTINALEPKNINSTYAAVGLLNSPTTSPQNSQIDYRSSSIQKFNDLCVGKRDLSVEFFCSLKNYHLNIKKQLADSNTLN